MAEKKEKVKRDIAIQILLELLIGKSSKLYKQLYDEGIISGGIGANYEFSENYAHVLISGQSNEPEQVYRRIKEEINRQKQEGISENDFNRIKKKVYGEYVKSATSNDSFKCKGRVFPFLSLRP